jgi:transcriptional regulator with XRE-family HTH domain
MEETPLSKYMDKKELSPEQVAEQLEVTVQYVYMLLKGKTTPSFALAWKMERWSEQAIMMQAWVPFLPEAKRGVVPPKRRKK